MVPKLAVVNVFAATRYAFEFDVYILETPNLEERML